MNFLFSFSQKDNEIEELKSEISQLKDDSTKVKKLNRLGSFYSKTDYITALKYFKEALDISIKIKYPKGQIIAYTGIADENWNQTNYDNAFKYYFKAYRTSDSIHDEVQVATALYNLGWVSCILQHNYKDDIYLYKSLAIFKRLNDTNGLLRIYNALGSYYSDKYSSLKHKNDFDSAVYYSKAGIDLSKKHKSVRAMAIFYMNLGGLFYGSKDFKSAKFYQSNAIDIYKTKADSFNLMFAKCELAKTEIEFGNYKDAIDTLNKVLNYTRAYDIKDMEVEILLPLANAYYKIGKYKDGFDFYKDYVNKKLEIDKKSYSNNLASLENSYSLEKSETNVSQLKQANEIEELKNKKKSYFILVLVVIGLVVIIIAFLLFRQNKQKQITNLQLKEQNQIIFEKKQEIDHSIQYAKGIQLAVLPELADLKNKFPESFVFYKPKDVVSGDFYWFGKLNDDFYCLAADCTGHGVPGALMSIIGMDKIVQAIYEKGITAPNKILSFLNIQIKNVLKQHSDASIQKDGMDIALLKFNKDLSIVEYSAANRPLYLVRDGILLEYKADKTAIAGFTPNNQEFVNQEIALQKNDCLFISTDGYADQFGGPVGKKMMTKKLKEVLVSISNLPSIEQQTLLENNFTDWTGDNEQVDDVLIIGIKI
ncbi:MAG: SpoIIE family protein phosphatase [Bacteroidota bacterium]|nr:SpoIIE family protein phosphatase [Bacteroidota bacterium]